MNQDELKAKADAYRGAPVAISKTLSPEDLKAVKELIQKEDEEVKVIKQTNIGVNPDLSGIDYGNLAGGNFKKLILEILGKLEWNKKYLFAEYKIETSTAERYEGVKDSPRDIISIRIKDTKPVKKTLMYAKDALSLNGVQVQQSKNDPEKVFIKGAQFQNSGRIFLLAK